MSIVASVILTTMMGCEALQKVEDQINGASNSVSNSVREQKEQTEEITNASDAISGSLNDIDTEADSILDGIALAPNQTDPLLGEIEDSAEQIKEHVDGAQLEQVRIEEALEDLEQANTIISAAIGTIEKLEDLVIEYEQSDREIRQEALQNLHGFITLFFVIGFGMLIGGAFITFWVNGKLGGIVLAIGVLTVGFAAASQYYLEEIATIGLVVLIVGFVAAAGVIGWMLIEGRNDKKAIAEIVELIEETKDHLTLEERKEIFGRDGFASRMTSDLTKKIVAQVKIKNGFKNLGKTFKKT